MHLYFKKQFDLVVKVELGSFISMLCTKNIQLHNEHGHSGLEVYSTTNLKVPLLEYEPRTPFNEISNTFSLYSDMQYMEHLMYENVLLRWANVTLQRHN